jgi:hypothetical protein
MTLYDCDGIYPLQEVRRYPYHIVPRYRDDQSFRATPKQRLPCAEKLRAYLARSLTEIPPSYRRAEGYFMAAGRLAGVRESLHGYQAYQQPSTVSLQKP